MKSTKPFQSREKTLQDSLCTREKTQQHNQYMLLTDVSIFAHKYNVYKVLLHEKAFIIPCCNNCNASKCMLLCLTMFWMGQCVSQQNVLVLKKNL